MFLKFTGASCKAADADHDGLIQYVPRGDIYINPDHILGFYDNTHPGGREQGPRDGNDGADPGAAGRPWDYDVQMKNPRMVAAIQRGREI